MKSAFQARYFYDTGAFFVHAGVDNRKIKQRGFHYNHEMEKISKFKVSKKTHQRSNKRPIQNLFGLPSIDNFQMS